MRKRIASYWKGKSVILTGASSGLGWAIVEALAPYQVKFCLLSRREDKMLELALKLKDSGSTFWINRCDVRKRNEVQAAIQKFYHQVGKIDVVWVNAGIAKSSSFYRWNWDDIEAVLDTNLKGAIYTTQASLEFMVPQKAGAIVAIGSVASVRGLPARSIYGLSKAALEHYIESMAAELPQIQFTLIHPGFVDTPINQGSPHRIWLMSPEKAAKIMIKAVVKQKKKFIYPIRMKLLYYFARTLPVSIYLFIARQVIAKRMQLKREA